MFHSALLMTEPLASCRTADLGFGMPDGYIRCCVHALCAYGVPHRMLTIAAHLVHLFGGVSHMLRVYGM